jgi:hypothetical protein
MRRPLGGRDNYASRGPAANNTTMKLSAAQLQAFNDDGFLILRDVLTEKQTKDLQKWAHEVHDWTTTENSPWMPYEVWYVVI